MKDMMNLTSSIMFQSILYLLKNDSTTLAPDTTKCYDIYGCYSIAYPWISESRPVSYFPMTPEEMNVRYATFTRYHIKIPYFLDPNDPKKIRARKFNPKGPFFFIAHGYLESGDKPWIQTLTETLLSLNENKDATVIAIDWRGASAPPYSQAVANIRLLGMITAHLIKDMSVELQLKNLDNFHFIGHSLGAHLGGYTGQALQTEFGLKIGRISGLDPAEPFFGKVQNLMRLDRSDAKYVDAIHTDASPFISGGLGLVESVGHVDFYPNGGANQPGCSQGMMQYINSKEGSLIKGIRQFLGCNHLRSYQYFIESITTSCPFLVITCPSYQDFAKGACFQCGAEGNQCIRFGYFSNLGYNRLVERNLIKQNESFVSYMMTGDIAPFCRLHYRVTVNISSSIESSSHGGEIGRLWIVFVTKNGTKSEKIPLEEYAGPHKPGSQKTIIITTSELNVPESAYIEWEYETNLLNPFTWRLLMSPRIYIAWVYIESLEHHKNKILICPHLDSPILANTPTHFQQYNCRNIYPIKISTISTFNN